jgi:hypothetical protein
VVPASVLAPIKEARGIAGGLASLIAFALIAITSGNAFWPVSLMFLLSAVAVVVGVLWDQQRRVVARGQCTRGRRR